MVNEIVLGYSTHREHHSSFYKSYHRNNDFPLFSMGYYLVWGIEPQSHFLWYVISGLKGLYFGRGVYEVFKSTHLDELRGTGEVFKEKYMNWKVKKKRT